MSDRIVVIHEGRLTGSFSATKATEEKVIYYATGGASPATERCLGATF